MGNKCFKFLKGNERRKERGNNDFLLHKLNKNFQVNTEKYFQLVKLRVRQFYEENQHNQFNLSISLDKKDFSSIASGKKIVLNPNEKFIYWKNYLTNYLLKEANKGQEWAKLLLK